MELIKDVWNLSPEVVDVQHNPMTARYSRSFDKKMNILKNGYYLGIRKANYQNGILATKFAGR